MGVTESLKRAFVWQDEMGITDYRLSKISYVPSENISRIKKRLKNGLDVENTKAWVFCAIYYTLKFLYEESNIPKPDQESQDFQDSELDKRIREYLDKNKK